MSRRYEIFLAGPMPERQAAIGAALVAPPIEIEEILHRLVLALKGAGYTVHSSAYEIVLVADPGNPPLKMRWQVVDEPISRGRDALTPRQREVIAEEIERRSHLTSTVEVPDQSGMPDQPQGENHE